MVILPYMLISISWPIVSIAQFRAKSSKSSKQINSSLIIIFLVILAFISCFALFLFFLLLQLLLLWRLGFLLLFLLLLLLIIIFAIIILIVVLAIWGVRRNVVPVLEVLLQIDWWVLARLLSCVTIYKYHRLRFRRRLNCRSLPLHKNRRLTLVFLTLSFLIRFFPYFELIFIP